MESSLFFTIGGPWQIGTNDQGSEEGHEVVYGLRRVDIGAVYRSMGKVQNLINILQLVWTQAERI